MEVLTREGVSPSGKDSFLDWARSAKTSLRRAGHRGGWDISALLGAVGGATVVALSEAVHGAAEPLGLRNAFFEQLTATRAFTAIAIESGVVESRVVHEYVRGGFGEIRDVLAGGIGWNMDVLPQNAALVRWLEKHNAASGRSRKINFYGFDVSGSPGVRAQKGVATALSAALDYLERADPAAAEDLRARLRPFWIHLTFDFYRSAEAPGYDRLPRADRDVVTATIADLLILLTRNEGYYVRRRGAIDYAWAYRAALDAGQVDAFLRHIPPDWSPAGSETQYPLPRAGWLSDAADVRDRAQADNLAWVLEQEGRDGKLLVYAHRYHVSAAPVRASWSEHGPQFVMGTYLRARLGKRLVTIGNVVGQGEIRTQAMGCTIEPASPSTLDGLAGAVSPEPYVLDLRTAPAPVRQWLKQVHPAGHGAHGGTDEELSFSPGEAFDLLVYFPTLTPACPSA